MSLIAKVIKILFIKGFKPLKYYAIREKVKVLDKLKKRNIVLTYLAYNLED